MCKVKIFTNFEGYKYDKLVKKYLFLALALLALATSSCGPKDVIPVEDMTSIFCEFYMTDRYLDENPELRAQADTTIVYLPVLRKYGYSQDQFLNSVKYYLTEPEKFNAIFRRVQARMSEREKELNQIPNEPVIIQENLE